MTQAPHPRFQLLVISAMICGFILLAPFPSQGNESEASTPYAEHVKCEKDEASGQTSCKIDLFLTRGYRAFSQCQVCHGLEAGGSSFAPSLLQKLKEIDRERFVHVVTEGYQGPLGVMPGWKENPNVMKYMDNLYLYLLARADGAIPPGKIPRFDR